MKKMYLILLSGLLTFSMGLTGCSNSTENVQKFNEEKVMIANGNHDVPGILTMPTNASEEKPAPVVLLLHGTGGNKNELGDIYIRLASKLAEDGYASLRIDFAGGGDSTQPYVENNFDDSVTDALKSIDYLESLPKVDDTRIGVLGYSQGGRTAQVVAGRSPKVSALATWASASSNGNEGFEMFFTLEEEANKNGSTTLTLPWGTKLELGKKWFDAMKNSRALDEVANYKGPLLAIAGSEDQVVPTKYAKDLVMHAGGNDATLRIIEGADHGYKILANDQLNPDQSIAEELLTITTDWFKAKL
ncbi:alpha/beta fold hydrolase [Clostridium gasigenes]|uniref:alpha/beta hydrolase n=1 Tax=Clostridium gasigenes TaxID=94869 RepID=UPI001C0CB687|nr:alpha/beta fold hydrolase [Clostridium gasigenes]MBU3135762.1 alpha/beta fold hydrolase [Clostridium gasigenes]